jgi:hypothetical protein
MRLPWRWLCYQWGKWLAADEGDERLELLGEELAEASVWRGLGVAVEAWMKMLLLILKKTLNGQKNSIPVATVLVFPWVYNIRLNCVVLRRESGVGLHGMNHHRLQVSSVSIPITQPEHNFFLHCHRQVCVCARACACVCVRVRVSVCVCVCVEVRARVRAGARLPALSICWTETN